MGVQRSNGEVVLGVLLFGQTLGQLAFVVVIDVGEVGDAMAGRALTGLISSNRGADQVAHRLGTVTVATGGDQRVEIGGQRRIERDGETFHESLLPAKKVCRRRCYDADDNILAVSLPCLCQPPCPTPCPPPRPRPLSCPRSRPCAP